MQGLEFRNKERVCHVPEDNSAGRRLRGRGGEDAAPKDADTRRSERAKRLEERRFGELLLEEGVITAEQLEHATSIREQYGGDAARALIALGYVEIEDFLSFLARQPDIHAADLSQYEIEKDIIQLVPRALAERYQLFPVDRNGDCLRVGIARPLAPESMHEIEARTGLSVRALLCNADDVHAAIDRYYIQAETAGPPLSDEVGLRGLEIPIKLKLVARLVGQIDTFPALPETVHRARDAMTNPFSSISDVSKIVVMDPPIAGKVLSVANSAAYGFPRQIEDLTLAMTLLGLRETYSIILSAAVLNVFEKTKHFNYKRFWIESMCCAAATRYVLKASGRRSLTGVFAAGLLHDIGRLVLAEAAPGLYRKIPTTYKAAELVAAEEDILGISHMEAGYELALHWSLPAEIAEPIRFHHRPTEATQAHEAVAVVSLANAMAHALGANIEENRNAFAGYEDSLALLKIDPEIAEAMLDEFVSRRDDSLRDALE